MTIQIKPSPTADTRTCDWNNVSKRQLILSSLLHIENVGQGVGHLARMLTQAAAKHDYDKISDIDQFHSDFMTGFEERSWWVNHLIRNRHHLQKDDGVRADVNLIDVLEYIVDCVMAGMSRSGSVYDLQLRDEVLQRAFQNTVDLLKRNVEVVE